MIKVTHLNKAETALVGLKVPAKYRKKQGGVGFFVEDILESLGYEVNRGAGVDLPGLFTEVKTRDVDATSSRQIGSMTWMDIAKTPWDASPIKEKFQQQFIVYHKDFVIVKATMNDFSHPEIQGIMANAYESARELINSRIADGCDQQVFFGDYIRGADSSCYWEHQNSNSYQFRFSDSVASKVERMSYIGANPLFDFGE